MYIHLTVSVNVERYSMLFIDLKDQNAELVFVGKCNSKKCFITFKKIISDR